MLLEQLRDTQDRFLSFLVQERVLSSDIVPKIKMALVQSGKPVDAVLSELGLAEEQHLAQQAAKFAGVKYLQSPAIDHGLATELGLDFLKHHNCVPVSSHGRGLLICQSDPTNEEALRMIRMGLGSPASLTIAPRSTILKLLSQMEADLLAEGNAVLDAAIGPELSEHDLEQLRANANDAPVVALLTQICAAAVEARATDIHFEPNRDVLTVRLRIDGVLRATQKAPIALLAGLMSRLKILCGLNISERRLPQDGRLRVNVAGVPVDMRLSTVPSVDGESAVLRILDQSSVALDLHSLGYASSDVEKLDRVVKQRSGLVLVTGPTGSGKTTTLHALLSRIVNDGEKIFAVEDPVERQLSGVSQLQIDPAIGLTFPVVLRSILRQDPDIIMVGEIRDKETADLAVRASLTGHLVLATLHTNSAYGAVDRLRDLGVENYLLSATLRAVLAQRLLRRSCQDCHGNKDTNCTFCEGSGYKGRTVAYEVGILDAGIREAIETEKGASALEELDHQFIGMGEHAKRLVAANVTDNAEIYRIFAADG